MTQTNPAAEELGSELGRVKKRVAQLEQESGPVEAGNNLIIQNLDELQLSLSYEVLKKEPKALFRIEHPIYGQVEGPGAIRGDNENPYSNITVVDSG